MPEVISCHHRHEASLATGAVIGAGRIIDKDGICRQRRLACFALVYVDRGEGWFEDERSPRHDIRAGDAFVLHPGIFHSYGPGKGSRWNEWWFMMEGSLFNHLADSRAGASDRPVLRPGLHPELIATFQQLVDERVTWSRGTCAAAMAAAVEAELASRVLALLHRVAHFDLAGEPAPPPWMAVCVAALEEHLERPIDLRHLASSSGLSYERFRKVFAQIMGMPPARYRALRRIDRAKALLMSGTPIATVADELGFCDVFFFTRQFKAITGMTPGRFQGR